MTFGLAFLLFAQALPAGDWAARMVDGIHAWLDAAKPVKSGYTLRESLGMRGSAFDPRPVIVSSSGAPSHPPECYAVLLPDADEAPETARRLAPPKCVTYIVDLVNTANRERVYRMAYQAGRHIIGYEVEKVMTVLDRIGELPGKLPVEVHGHGEGAVIAWYAGAVDGRVGSVTVSGYAGPGRETWREPIYRNMFGVLEHAPRPREVRMVAAPAAGPKQTADPPFEEMVRYTQELLRTSHKRRAERKPEREELWRLIGRLPEARPGMPEAQTEGAVRTRVIYDAPEFTGTAVKIPVDGSVFAYGILLVPKDLKPGERRPVVIAQHGLEGRPEHLVEPPDEKTARTYKRFAAELARRGYVVFAPQNPYIFEDRFRTIQRKANPLGLTLFSFVAAQHRAILDWLKAQPYVRADRIGFYGLSYGGFTAMRIPALFDDYAAVICSGNFTEWVWKTTTLEEKFSYMFTREYEIFEFNLAETFNHAEMAALIFPKPFMVERGHRDGVGLDEWVAYEYAKVKRLYDEAGFGDRTEIEYFNGVHEIHGVGTYAFLDRWLKR